MKDKKWIISVLGLVALLVSEWAKDKETENMVREEVDKALKEKAESKERS